MTANERPTDMKISVIVAIHGVADYLEKCLSSLAAQDFAGRYEVICVNDRACDACPDIIDGFVERYPGLFVRLDADNGNPSYTRNDGMRAAHGEYVTFVDGDDYVEANHLSNFYRYAVADDADIVVSSYHVVKGTRRCADASSLIAHGGKYSAARAKRILFRDLSMRGYVWNKLFKRDVIADLDFLDVHCVIEDVVFSYMAFCQAKKVVVNKKRTYNYVYRNNSLINFTTSTRQIRANANTLAFLQLYERARDSKYRLRMLLKRVQLNHFIHTNKGDVYVKREIKEESDRFLRLLKKYTFWTGTPFEKAVKEAHLDEKLTENFVYCRKNPSRRRVRAKS